VAGAEKRRKNYGTADAVEERDDTIVAICEPGSVPDSVHLEMSDNLSSDSCIEVAAGLRKKVRFAMFL